MSAEVAEPWVLAIDFGTTNTVVALRQRGLDEPVTPSATHHRLGFPSQVVIRDGKLLAGPDAARRSVDDVVIRTPKQHLATGEVVLVSSADGGVCEIAAVNLAAAVLAAAAGEAVEVQGGEPSAVVLTYPATWGRAARQRLGEAATAAGLTNLAFISEPVAASLHRAIQSESTNALVAVYDLGGGTFDVTVLQRVVSATGLPSFEVIGVPAGLPGVGGERFDALLRDHALDTATTEAPDLLDAVLDLQAQPIAHGRAQERMLLAGRSAKHELTHRPRSSVELEPVVDGPTCSVEVTRAEFEALIADDLAATSAVLQRCLDDAGVAVADLDAVHLVGGSSRIPAIRESLQADLGVASTLQHDPEVLVAGGATFHVEPRGTRVSAEEASAADVLRAVGELAVDIADHGFTAYLGAAQRQLAEPEVTAVVLGRFSSGKSSLINALLGRTELLPIGVDICTDRHVVIEHAEAEQIEIVTKVNPEGRSIGEEELADYVAAGGRLGQDVRLARIGLPVELLRRGLSLVDTPGLGAIDAPHTEYTLRLTKEIADAVVLVLDANRPVTEDVLPLLDEVAPNGIPVLVVLSRVDEHNEWESIRDENRSLLGDHLAGGAVPPIVGTSALYASLALETPDELRSTRLRGLSGLEALEAELSALTTDRVRRARLNELLVQCRDFLARSQEMTEAQIATLSGDTAERQDLVDLIQATERARSKKGWPKRWSTRTSTLAREAEPWAERLAGATRKRARDWVLAARSESEFEGIGRAVAASMNANVIAVDPQASTLVATALAAELDRLVGDGIELPAHRVPSPDSRDVVTHRDPVVAFVRCVDERRTELSSRGVIAQVWDRVKRWWDPPRHWMTERGVLADDIDDVLDEVLADHRRNLATQLETAIERASVAVDETIRGHLTAHLDAAQARLRAVELALEGLGADEIDRLLHRHRTTINQIDQLEPEVHRCLADMESTDQ